MPFEGAVQTSTAVQSGSIIKTGAGKFYGMTYLVSNSAATGTLYDSLTAAGKIVSQLFLNNTASNAQMDYPSKPVPFNTGLTFGVSGSGTIALVRWV